VDQNEVSKERNRETRQGQKQRKKKHVFEATRSSVVSGLLCLILCLLLFGLARELPPPARASPPLFFTEVAYSALIHQTQEEQLLAANLQGEELTGLLKSKAARSFQQAKKGSPWDGRTQADIAAFLACTPGDPVACLKDGEEIPQFPTTRVIYAHIPPQAEAALLSLLMEKHVVVMIHPIRDDLVWGMLIVKCAPYVLFLFFALWL
jgi:hypothetical protein